ncbi:hypothetical protein JL722_7009 [Aureococcus anophagefferens]|nr:hypothetical protein JL722_7009 [Aureococcus anophagefferens]
MRAVTLLIALPAALHAFRAPTPLVRPNSAVAATPVSELLAGEVAVGDASMTRAAVVADLAARTEACRAPAADVLPYATDDERDAWLLRFCAEAEDVDLDAVAARVEASVAWRLGEGKPIVEAARDAVAAATATPGSWDNGPVLAAAPHSAKIEPWVPAGKLMTMRGAGGLVYAIRAGLIDDKGLMADVDADALSSFFLYAKAVNERVVAALTARTGELATVVTVNDLQGVDLFGDASFRNALSAASKQGDAIFPGLSGPTVLLNLPRLLGALVKLFTPLFPPAVRKKLKFDSFDIGAEDASTPAARRSSPTSTTRQLFEAEGRTFRDGEDPRWTAIHKNDYTNKALQFYHEDYGWNKFCFTGGILEIRAKLPGRYDVGGLWPGMWMMGNLARATYVASSNHMWPFSYEACARKDQRRQEINGCMPRPHFGLNPDQGRGAPEIDLLEVMPGEGWLPWGLKKPYYSTSLQLAPAAPIRPFNGAKPAPGTWYEHLRYGPNTSQNVFFYGMRLDHGSDEESYWADAVSGNTPIGASEFEDFHTYRLEWKPKGSIDWYKDGKFLYGIDDASISSLTGGQVPDEPMYLLLNTALSSTWGFPAPCPPGCACDCQDCAEEKCACGIAPGFCASLPASFLVDYVRVYQDRGDRAASLGCDTASHPSKAFIEAHEHRYVDPDRPGRAPLERVATGGARCATDDDCGGRPAGACRRRRCACGAGRAGPRSPRGATTRRGRGRWRLPAPAVPPQLAATGLALVAAFVALARARALAFKAERRR